MQFHRGEGDTRKSLQARWTTRLRPARNDFGDYMDKELILPSHSSALPSQASHLGSRDEHAGVDPARVRG